MTSADDRMKEARAGTEAIRRRKEREGAEEQLESIRAEPQHRSEFDGPPAEQQWVKLGPMLPPGYENDPGSKADDGKPRTELLPFGALDEVAHVFTFGAQKYGAYNWHGLSCSRLFAAGLRHLFAWWRGENLDPETGRSHLAHAACCVLMVLEQHLDRPTYDDRP